MCDNSTGRAALTTSAPALVAPALPVSHVPFAKGQRRWARTVASALSMAAALVVVAGPTVRADIPSGPTCNHNRLAAGESADRFAAGSVCVIVRFDGSLDARRDAQLKSLGADIYRRLPLIRSVALRIPSRSLPRLKALPFVTHVSNDMQVRKCDQFTVGSSGATTAWQSPYNLSGSGVTIAVVDSGVHHSQDLMTPSLLNLGLLNSSRVVQSVNFVTEAGQNTTDDPCGHGTHVAGIISGNGASSTGLTCFKTFYGIAPQTKLVNVRVLDSKGMSDVSTVVAGLQWVVQNRAKYNIRVINLSLGHPVGESYTTDPLCQAVEAAWKAGIVVVCAAGNEGRLNSTNTPGLDNEGWGTAYGSIQCPGNDPYVITVGATKSMDGNRIDDRIATYSSRGPSRLDLVLKPDIIAPGNRVISVLSPGSYLANTYSSTNQVPWGYYSLSLLGGNSDNYFYLSGTSMATPVVAGAAALMLQASPNLSPDTIKARLMLSADKWLYPNGSADSCTFGAGYMNIPAALKCTAVATQYAMSPTLSEDSQGNVYINVNGSIWGTHAIWGTGINDLHAIWGTLAIWGTNTLSASHAIWGTSVWSDHAIWGTDTSAVDLTTTAINGE